MVQDRYVYILHIRRHVLTLLVLAGYRHNTNTNANTNAPTPTHTPTPTPPGANSAVSGLVALLSAAESLGASGRSGGVDFSALPRQIVFAAFQV